MRQRRVIGALAIAGLLAAAVTAVPADAKTFRWANKGDTNSMDPYGRNETFLLSFALNIYEPLVRRDKQLKLEPALAVKWTQTSPTVWHFELRPGVKFHDGTPFTADDVVFSYDRARLPGSNIASTFAAWKEVKKIDDHTVDIVTKDPDPILPDEITSWAIMSKAWCEKNNATHAADLTKNEETYANRNANGTGPFMLKLREPDSRTVLVPNPTWWDKPEHNLDEVDFRVISNDSTRVAALLSGDVDMVYEVPPQDTQRIGSTPGYKVIQSPELRTIYLGMDQLRDQLTDSAVKGKNPFKDIRVRRAFYQAIDEKAIATRVMRGFGSPTGLLVGPGVNGFDETMNERFPVDIAGAKKLLAEAGYPDGFEVGMDCPNDRYVNDEDICKAVVAMLARINIKVDLNAQTRLKFFAKVNAPVFNTSFYLLGWTPSTYDAHNTLLNLVHCRDEKTSAGMFNNGGYCNPKIDDLIGKIGVETDKAKRDAMIHDAQQILKDDFGYIPLHQQKVVWAASDKVDLVQQADNYFQLRYVKLK